MDKKRRNRFLIALACMALVIGVFALITRSRNVNNDGGSADTSK